MTATSAPTDPTTSTARGVYACCLVGSVSDQAGAMIELVFALDADGRIVVQPDPEQDPGGERFAALRAGIAEHAHPIPWVAPTGGE